MYQFRGFVVPDYMIPGLEDYINQGILPGDFLQNVLKNDLRGACAYADDMNLHNLPAYVGYMMNEAPGPCWGSKSAVDRWVGHNGLSGVNHDG